METLKKLYHFGWQYKHHIIALILIAAWCVPYVTTGDRIEWGDFGFFAQAYEAIKITILEYGQFPWWNPWIAGGVPLYANPQIGVFSLQTPLVLIFGGIVGLKLALILYTLAGYSAMYLLLRKYFRVTSSMATLLSLLWIFSSFFVSHLPSHFTFVWYMLAPLYVYLALILKDWRGGLALGIAFGVMALSAVHNPFFHIGFVTAVILAVRLCRTSEKQSFLLGLLAALGSFLMLAAHRVIFAVQNVRDFPRELGDPAASITNSLGGLLVPFSVTHDLPFIHYPSPSNAAPFGFGEITATIGIFATLATFISIVFLAYNSAKSKKLSIVLRILRQKWCTAIVLILAIIIALGIGLGDIHTIMPYSLMQYLPVIGDMRVSSRWFIWVSFCSLLLIGCIYQNIPKKSFTKVLIATFLTLGVIEMFFLNIGYQHNNFRHETLRPHIPTSEIQFTQMRVFGASKTLPNGVTIPNDGHLSRFFREYEATRFNIGSIQANDALIYKTRLDQTPLCGWEHKCPFIISKNAEVIHWSPNKIILARTRPGPVIINANNSSYFTVNDRYAPVRVAEPYQRFVISDPSAILTIETAPRFLNKTP